MEYILLIAVMVTISITFFNKLNDFMIDNPNSVLNSYLNGFDKVFNGGGVNASYKRFNLPR